MSAQPSVCAVITNYNSEGTVLQALRALLDQDSPPAQIIVVDNGSQDAARPVQVEFPQVKLVQLKTNTGLSHARNVGLGQAASDYVLFLDDDVYLAPGCLGRLLQTAIETQATAVCPRVVLHPGDDLIQCEGAAVHFAGMLVLNRNGVSTSTAPAEPHPTGGFIGACILFRRSSMVDLGGFDEDYFFYFEDLELSYRLKALGHGIWCEPRAVARHDRGAGTPGLSFRGAGDYPRRRAYLTLRNSWLTVLLHYQARTLVALWPVFGMLKLGSLGQAISRGWWREWFGAATSLLREAPSILARRRRWQRLRRVPDRDILVGGPLPFAPGFIQGAASQSAVRLLNSALRHYWSWISRWL